METAIRRLTIEPSVVLKSPAFHSRYPKVLNGQLIAQSSRASMEQSWNQGLFPDRPVGVFRIKDAYLADECLILDRDLQVISNASDAYSDEEVERAVAYIKAAEAAGTLPRFGRPAIVTKRRAAGNYGHFLAEMLPMGWLGAQMVADTQPLFLVHRAPAPMQDAMFRALRLLGVPLDRVIVQGFREPMFFEDLLIVRGLTAHGTYMSPLSVAACAAMAAAVERPAIRSLDKLFVRRSPGWGRGREMHNENEVADRLTARGYRAIEPGLMPLEQQISTFRSATEVVGVAGAAMTNIMFCEPGTKVTLLFPGSFADTFFWFIAQHRGLDYLEIRGKQTTDDGPNSWAAGFTVSPSDIQYLEEARSANTT